MNAFAVKMQSSAVKTESLVRNVQHLPVCCLHVSAARACTHMWQGSAFTLLREATRTDNAGIVFSVPA